MEIENRTGAEEFRPVASPGGAWEWDVTDGITAVLDHESPVRFYSRTLYRKSLDMCSEDVWGGRLELLSVFGIATVADVLVDLHDLRFAVVWETETIQEFGQIVWHPMQDGILVGIAEHLLEPGGAR